MALNKFLFTSAQRQSVITSAIGAVSGTVSKTGKALTDFGGKMFDKSKVSSKGPNNELTAGQFILGGLSDAVGFPIRGLGFLLELLKDFAGDALFLEMFLNPDSMDIKYTIPNIKKETQGGVVIHHFRPDLPVITMSGIVGWLRNESILDSAVNSAVKTFVGTGNLKDAGKSFKESFSSLGTGFKSLSSIQKFRENSRKLVNSPRKFMEDLRKIALSPMYFPEGGIEKYNTKKIVVFNKQYPVYSEKVLHRILYYWGFF